MLTPEIVKLLLPARQGRRISQRIGPPARSRQGGARKFCPATPAFRDALSASPRESQDFFLPVGNFENIFLTTYLVLALALGVGMAWFVRRQRARKMAVYPTMWMKTQGVMQNSGNFGEIACRWI